MIPTISQACSMHADFATDIEDYAAGGCPSIELWLTKLEAYLDTHSRDELEQLRVTHAVEWPVASFQGGLFRTGPGLEESKQHFLRRLELCQQLSIGTLVMAVDPLPPLSQELLDQIPERMQQISAWAAPYGTRLALEFQHDAPFLNNLKSLMHLLDELDQPNLGVCLDTMAFEKSSSKESDLELLGARLFHVHLCDFDGDFRELWSKHEAVLPGDGSCRHQAIARYLKAHAYEGAVSVQLQNPMIWAIPPRQLAEVARMSIERFLDV